MGKLPAQGCNGTIAGNIFLTCRLPKIRYTFLGAPHIKDYSMLGSPLLGQLPLGALGKGTEQNVVVGHARVTLQRLQGTTINWVAVKALKLSYHIIPHNGKSNGKEHEK